MIRIGASQAVLTMAPQHEPIQQIESGQTVVVETMDCFSNTISSEDQLFSSIGWDCVNPATGPIAVAGAEPGDTLKVEVLDIVTANVGTMTTHPDYGALPGSIAERTRRIEIEAGEVVFNDKLRFPVNPMIGVIGTAPADDDVLVTDVLQKIGGFDPAYFMYVEDADLTQKVLREGTVWLAPQFHAVHAWHRAPMRDAGKFKMQLVSMGRYFKKWGCGKGSV